MKNPVRFLTLLFVACLIGLVGLGAVNERLERDVANAKATYRANPNSATLAAVESATAAFEAAQPRGSSVPTRAVVAESEPNNSAGTADPITLTINTTVGDSGTGNIMPAGDRDWWTAAGVSVGDLLFVLFDTGASGTGTDGEMSVFEGDGTTLIEFDDDSGDGLGSAVAAIVPTAGSIVVELNEFGDNGTIEPYNLFVAAFPPAGPTRTAETEPNDTFATGNLLPNGFATGDLGDASDDFFRFNANLGDRIASVCNNDPDADASNADTEISLIDPDGSTILASEAPFTATSQNAVAGTAAAAGLHALQVADGGSGADTDYACVVWVNDVLATPVELQSFSIE